MWTIEYSFITGLMFGFELVEKDADGISALILDIGIIRLAIFRHHEI